MRVDKRFFSISYFAFFSAFMFFVLSQTAMAEKIGLIDGLWVMKKVEDRYEGDDVQEDMYLTLERTGIRGGKPRHLDVRWLKKDFGREDKVVIHFIGPEYVYGATLLLEIKPYVDDGRWLYFPERNLISKINAKDQHSSFMGTDFTYYDLSEREPDEENHKLLKIEELNGRLCYVVETTPKEGVHDGYSKKITWVDKERFTKMRINYFNKTGRFQKQFDPKKWEKISGVWTAHQLVMENFIKGHKTTINRKNIKYNQKLVAEYFLPYRVDCVQYKEGKFSLLPFDQRPTKVGKKANRSEKRRKFEPPQRKIGLENNQMGK
jgi:hypothetical protein